MQHRGWLAVALIVIAASAVPTGQEKAASVAAAWVREPGPGETSAPAFLTIDNPGMYELWIVSAATDAAKAVELREARPDDPSEIRTVKELNVPAYGKLDMGDLGARLMLVGLTRPLKAGEHVMLTLKTDGSATLKVDALVRSR